MKSQRGFLFQDSSASELVGKTPWENGKLHRIGKAVSLKKYSKKTPPFEKDLVSSSPRRISHKRGRKMKSIKKKDLNKLNKKSRGENGGKKKYTRKWRGGEDKNIKNK